VIGAIIEKTVQHFISGGVVMPALLISSLYMWILIFVKVFQLLQIRKSEVPFEECIHDCAAGKEARGAEWQVKMLNFAMDASYLKGKHRKKLIDDFTDSVASGMGRHITTVLVLASAAPLFGLFGTVTGMISTFDVISLYGTGNPKAMASGISIALITTQAGLVVAVPGLIVGNLLKRRASVLQDRVKLFGHMIVKELEA